MMWARRSIGPIAAVWLLCQVATLAAVPALLAASLAECVCGADAACPMHHKTAAGSKVCVMQSANADVPATLNLLFSIAGLVPTPQLELAPIHAADAVPVEHSPLPYRSS